MTPATWFRRQAIDRVAKARAFCMEAGIMDDPTCTLYVTDVGGERLVTLVDKWAGITIDFTDVISIASVEEFHEFVNRREAVEYYKRGRGG